MCVDEAVHWMVYSRHCGRVPRFPFKTEVPIPQVAGIIGRSNFSAEWELSSAKASSFIKGCVPFSGTRADCANDCLCGGIRACPPCVMMGQP